MNLTDILSPDEAVDYIRTRLPAYANDHTLSAHYLNSTQQSIDSLANVVMRVTSEAGNPSVILKHILPYVRAAKENGVHMPLNQNRIYTEVFSLNIWNNIQPGTAPKVYHYDDENFIILMEDLQGMKTLRSELIKQKRYPNFPVQLGQLLGRVSFYTSSHYLNRDEKKALYKTLTHMDTESFWNAVIFDRILYEATILPINPGVRDTIDAFSSDFKIRKEVQKLKTIFNENKQCLIHKDLHTSNIFISDNDVCIYDSEYAGYGPIAFDIGRLVGNILLNIASLHVGTDQDVEQRRAYQDYLINCIEDLLTSFSNQFECSWNSHVNGHLNTRDRFTRNAMSEGLGMAACTTICRLFDIGLCFDMKRIENMEALTRAQKVAIQMARYILLHWFEIHSPASASACVNEALNYARKCR